MQFLTIATPETAVCVITFMSYTVLKVGRARTEVSPNAPSTSNLPRR
jgi:hypothetical protein